MSEIFLGLEVQPKYAGARKAHSVSIILDRWHIGEQTKVGYPSQPRAFRIQFGLEYDHDNLRSCNLRGL